MIGAGTERVAKLDRAIARGLADARMGRTALAAEVFDRLEEKYRALGNLKQR